MGVRKGAYSGGGGGGGRWVRTTPPPQNEVTMFLLFADYSTCIYYIRVHTCVYVRKCTCTRIHVGTFSNDYVIHNFVRVYNSSPGPAKRTKKVLVIVPVPLRFK